MSLPWVKMPADFGRLPVVRRLPLRVRNTYTWLFVIASRVPRWLGYLADDVGQALSVRAISQRIAVPKSTVARHLELLHDRHDVLVQDLGGRYIVPLVIETERRFTTTRHDDDGSNRPVEKSTSRRGSETGECPSGKKKGPKVGHPLLLGLESEIDVTPSASPKPVENPVLSSLDDAISDATARHLLGRLAEVDQRWEALLADGKELRALRWLERLNRPALIQALQQATDAPSTVRKPGAWLVHTVRAIHGAAEEAVAR